MRDRDANTAWASAADGTLEERRYSCQNWRADVSAVLTSAGKLIESDKQSAYGTPYGFPTGDTDSDGDWDATDSSNITGGTYDIRKDAELDGDADAADATFANGIKGAPQTLGRGVLSSTAVVNRKGYAGYEGDINLVKLSHVRHRVFDSVLGRWTRRDPIGYADGANMYGYAKDRPATNRDPQGLLAMPCRGQLSHNPSLDNTQDKSQDPTNPFPTPRAPPDPIYTPRPGDMGPHSQDQDLCMTICAEAAPGPASRIRPNGRTACVNGKPIVCVCLDNIDRSLPSGLDSGYWRNEYYACVGAHEQQHAVDIDCSCTLGIVYLWPPFSGWLDGCKGECSELDGYSRELACVSSINCFFSPESEWDACWELNRQKMRALEQEINRRRTNCARCFGPGQQRPTRPLPWP